MKKKMFSILFSLALILSTPVCALAEQEELTESDPVVEISITSAEQFVSFSKNCIIDSYSENLMISLENSIDLRGCDFDAVPIFCGTFDGKGNTISGLDITDNGSVQGLFRYLTEGACVKNLNVNGNVTPGGSHSQIGGIAGNNSGSIINCKFSGKLNGSTFVGGIAGTNSVSGLIENCSVSGEISGDHFVGGISGKSSGVIRNCSNIALINVSARENSVELSDVTIDSMTNSEAANTVTDIGGIAGFSDGVIRSCENYGDTGYPKMGYNIGGIAGTQSGYIVDCTNLADVQGRKEIGGIAGQFEPVALIEYSEDTLQILEGQLDTMSGLVNQASYNAQANSSEINGELSVLSDQAGTAMDALDTLLFAENADPDSIIAAENALSSSMAAMPETFSNIAAATSNTVNRLSSDLMAVSNQINAMSDTINRASDNLGGSISDISDEDSEDNLSGKLENCINEGAVLADFNAGGIVGAISVENDLDVSEDWQQLGDESLNFDSKLRAVILRCENKGSIDGSKQNIGGIVGLQQLGLVKHSGNTGLINAEAAEYVGGVSGQSNGYIRNCYSKCIIQADSCVGGIAGSASVVSDCRSLTEIRNSREKQGGILGIRADANADIDDPIFGNLYMSTGTDIGAIDGISYVGLAQGIGKYEFFTLNDLPDVFNKLVLSFFADGREVAKITMNTGEKLMHSRIPEVPEKSGYIGSWENIDELELSALYFDTDINADYKLRSSVISSSTVSHNGKPFMLAEGNFTKSSSLSLFNTSFDAELSYGQKLAYCVSFDCGENSNIATIRCLIPDGLDHFKLYLSGESTGWRELEYSVDGSYAVVQPDSGDDKIAIVETMDYSLFVFAAAAVLIIVFALVFLFKLKKRSKSIV